MIRSLFILKYLNSRATSEYLFVLFSSNASNEYPRPPWPMYSNAARDIHFKTLMSFPSFFRISVARISRSYSAVSLHDWPKRTWRLEKAYFVSNGIEYRNESAHMFQGEDWIQHLPLLPVLFTCGSSVPNYWETRHEVEDWHTKCWQ